MLVLLIEMVFFDVQESSEQQSKAVKSSNGTGAGTDQVGSEHE